MKLTRLVRPVIDHSWARVLVGGLLLVVGGAWMSTHSTSRQQPSDSRPLEGAGLIALGVGSSLVASGLVSRSFERQVPGINVVESVEGLRSASPVYRQSQTVRIILTLDGDLVRATATHCFMLLTRYKRSHKIDFQLNTDIARLSYRETEGETGGFVSLIEPDETLLRGAALASHVRQLNGKIQFSKEYELRPRHEHRFEVETYGLFRRTDRLIWTVDQLSSDFRLRVEDRTCLPGELYVRVNHHQSQDINRHIERFESDSGPVIAVDFRGDVLPFQGFELQWSFPELQTNATGSGK